MSNNALDINLRSVLRYDDDKRFDSSSQLQK